MKAPQRPPDQQAVAGSSIPAINAIRNFIKVQSYPVHHEPLICLQGAELSDMKRLRRGREEPLPAGLLLVCLVSMGMWALILLGLHWLLPGSF